MATRFSTYGSVVLVDDGTGHTGTGTVKLTTNGRVWEVDMMSVSTNEVGPIVNDAEANNYLDGQWFAGTFTGSSGDTFTDPHYVDKPQTLSCVWTGGTIGATATMRIAGWAYDQWSELSK
jgi:hypothetical protein